MQLFRALLSSLLALLIFVSIAPQQSARAQEPTAAPPTQTPTAQTRLVESVDVSGNRRLRDEDILYYVQTRAGESFSAQQVERDLQAILALGFFDKTATSVTTTDGPRGGVVVTFNVSELPIIRDIIFDGLKAVTEADILKAFRENRVGVSKESIFDPVKINNAKRIIRELLAARGYPNATVTNVEDEISQTSVAVTFKIAAGDRVRVVEIEFTGNTVFSDGELRRQMKYVKEAGLITRFKGQDILDLQKLDFDLRMVRQYMASKGYFQARTGEPVVENLGERRTGFFIPLPLLSSTDEAIRITVPVIENKVYRTGTIKIEGNSILSEQVISQVIGLQPGEIANGQKLYKSLQEDLSKVYGSQGFIQYSYDVEPTFKDNATNPNEGTVDFNITINEGKQFTLRRLEFLGNTFTRDYVLRREFLLNEGDIFNQQFFEFSVLRLNQLGFFDPIDKDRDADLRTIEDEGLVDANVRVAERGRQQISFNGGLSGSAGSFFGLEYSTNNLLGRGETLSFNVAFGNRQRTFLFSFTEPYVRNRPITAGFSIFTRSIKFFGEGTSLSQNIEAQEGLFSAISSLNVNDDNLFTQTETGGSLFATSVLSEFYRNPRFLKYTRLTRIGLSYSLSATSVKDPAVNAENNQATFIPVIYRQPNIVTSRLTPSLVYDTRNASIDPTNGKQLALSLGFAGLGGDVRTIQPIVSYSQFIPVRRRNTDNPEVFAFRVLAGLATSFATTAKVRNTQSLAFIDGIPIYERFFLGGEDTIRGYNVRSITPYAPVDTFLTSRNVVFATNQTGTPIEIADIRNLAAVGLFTGISGNNRAQLPRTFTATGGDTQLLANLEYRIPIFGPVSSALFADLGSTFNLRTPGNQTFSSEFLTDQFLSPFSLSTFAVQNNPRLALSPSGGLIVRDARLVTREELNAALRGGQPIDPITTLPFGFQEVFLRGDVQTNALVGLSESRFAGIRNNFRSSLGAELRIQVPVVNVPFRLIYAFNPNARRGAFSELGGLQFTEKRSLFRFSIGRTF